MSKKLQVDIIRKRVSLGTSWLPVLDTISFGVDSGERVALLGPSGCGKTTILRLILGLDRAFEGEILLDGYAVTGPGLDRGIVFQEPRLLPWMTVRENIEFAIPENGHRTQAATHVAELMEFTGLTAFKSAWPRQLSGGMAQRAALARALVNLPELLLLDEPFGSLDGHTRVLMQHELERILEHENVTTLLVTHDVDEAIYLSDRVIALSVRPAHIRSVFPVRLARPRRRTDPDFAALRSCILETIYGDLGSSL